MGVVEDVVGAETADEVGLGGAGDAGDLRVEDFGELDCVAADAAGGADDQHLLTSLDLADVPQGLQCRAGGDGDNGGLGEAEVGRLVRELVLGAHGVLGERAGRHAVDLVAGGEAGDG